MIDVDVVYQRVLTLANKEQRGYITPQEFNIHANQAQMDIFEQYFYDLNQFRRMPGNNTVHSDMVTVLEEKIAQFHLLMEAGDKAGLAENGDGFELPDNLYRLDQIRLGDVQCERLNIRDYNEVRFSPLTRPTSTRPIYTVRQGNVLVINNGEVVDIAEADANNVLVNPANAVLIRTPERVNWTYIVVNNKALYNETAGDNQWFELHPSEETDLVYKILSLAGFTLKDEALYQIASGEDTKNIQQEKQ